MYGKGAGIIMVCSVYTSALNRVRPTPIATQEVGSAHLRTIQEYACESATVCVRARVRVCARACEIAAFVAVLKVDKCSTERTRPLRLTAARTDRDRDPKP